MVGLMKIASTLITILKIFSDPKAIWGLITWPIFSVTSYSNLSAMRNQGIAPLTIIDLGANVGQFAVAAAKIFTSARIYSFEPDPVTFSKLEKNTKKFDDSNNFNVAVGEKNYQANFFRNAYNHSSSLFELHSNHKNSFPDAAVLEEITVTVERLDAIMKDKPLQRPVLLKLDIQGAEVAALNGASETLLNVDFILIEVSFKPMYLNEMVFSDIMKLIEAKGFEFVRPISFLSDASGYEILQSDLLFKKSGIEIEK
jgi:FkbM family methyltransferase